MKIILFLHFLICFSNILDEVRKNVVDNALAYLPKREMLNFLNMALEMFKVKEKYLMSEAESVYFAYKWIAQNIEIDCRTDKQGEIITEGYITYREGKGEEIGILGLFNTICGLLNIESNLIHGLLKYRTRNLTQLIDTKEYVWNSVLIDNNYYLIDIIKGIGYCNRNSFIRTQDRNDLYFGIIPEESIRWRFPNDNKWQLLPKPVTIEEFKTFALLDHGFFKLFKTITPDVQTLKKRNNLRIKLTFDKPFGSITEDDVIVFSDELSKDYLPLLHFINEMWIKNGTFEFTCYPSSGYLDISLYINSTSYPIATYEVYNKIEK